MLDSSIVGYADALRGISRYFQLNARWLSLLFFVQVSIGLVKNGFKNPEHPARQEPSLSSLAVIELVKIIVSLAVIFLKWRKSQRKTTQAIHRQSRTPGLPLRGSLARTSWEGDNMSMNSEDVDDDDWAASPRTIDRYRDATRTWPNRQEIYTLAALGVLYVVHGSATSAVPRFADSKTFNVISLSLILLTGAQMQFIQDKRISIDQWTTAFLQIMAILLADGFTRLKSYNGANYAFVFSCVWLLSIILIATSHIYKASRHISIHNLDIFLFTFTFAAYAVAIAVHSFVGPSVKAVSEKITTGHRNAVASVVLLLLRAVDGVVTVAVLRYTSPFAFCVVKLLSTALIPPFSYICFGFSNGFSAIQWSCAVLAIYAAWSYSFDFEKRGPQSPAPKIWPFRSSAVVFTLSLLLSLLFIFLMSPLRPLHPHSDFVWKGSRLGQPPPMPHKLLPQSNGMECSRNPLPSSSVYPVPGPRPEGFNAFDDVLLVVFFSHPRYDVNLDGYREVYSRYFPNILFIGPATREDGGFLRSYDIVADSYESEEDFTDGWHKLAGRMAHHMFYTAVKDNPCYAGYLWAPFDAFLNVPRLVQFPQDRIWYHTPVPAAGRYMPNVALPEGSHKHPLHANVSQKAPETYAKEDNDWDAEGQWWWGQLNVGLPVCMPAYLQVPQRMRDRLEGLTGAPERFIGGSVDTLYVPGDLRDDLLDTLGIFLQTECFLEIVLPTTLHMILPEDQTIAYVDHWWMNDPPFNTSFIRQKWEEGYEVDSFHTFHWGDIQDGVWQPNENSVDDVRSVLRDSFIRQKMVIP